jgi:PAS domain S-box-containing protein
MNAQDMTREQLLEELDEMRRKLSAMEANEREHVAVEAALIESEAKFRKLTERSMVGVYIIQKGLFRYVNPRLAQIFGYEVDELVDLKGPEDLVAPQDWPAVDQSLRQRITSTAEAVYSGFRGLRKDGTVVHVEVYGSRMEYRGLPAVIGTLLDVTESMKVRGDHESELRKFRLLYDLAVAMTAERSLDDNLGLVVEQSRAMLGADKACIALRDTEKSDLYMHAFSGIVTEEFKRLRIPYGVGLGGKVAETGQLWVVEDYFAEVGPAFHSVAKAEGLMSGIAVPVKIGNANLGVLYVFNRERTPFSKADLDSLSLLGNLAAVEITRKRAESNLRDSQEEYKKLYEESRQAEELYRSVLNSSADAIVIYDMEGRTQYINPSFTSIFGWSMQELSDKRVPFVPDDEWEASFFIIQGIIRDGATCSAFETRRYTKDGRIRNISISASRYHDHEGKPAGILAILRDITRRKRAEQALRSSEERFRTLAEVAPFGLVVIAADEKAEYLNPKFTDIFGYTLDDVPDVDAWFLRAYHDKSRRIQAASMWREESARIRERDETGAEAVPRIFSVRAKDGEQKVIDFRAAVLPDGSILTTFLDVTAEARAREEIVRAKNEWERTFNAVSDLILILDGEQKITRANSAVAQRVGVDANSLTGLPCRQTIHGATTLAGLCLDRDLVADGQEHAAEITDKALGGVFDLRVSPLRRKDGKMIGSVHVARDVTAFKSMERARKRAVHHLSHELKTPLAVMKGSLKNLSAPEATPESVQANVDRIRRHLQRLSEIQRFVQEIVQPRPYRPALFPVVPTVEKVLDELRARSAHRNVSLVALLEPVETAIIDPVLLREVLETLVKNAVENTPEQGQVSVSLRMLPEGVLLEVRDTGVGITAEDRDFVFGAFHHTQDTEQYATRTPFAFNAGGKGLELLRLKILSEEGHFDIGFETRRCRHIPMPDDQCPGSVAECAHVTDPDACSESGGTSFRVLFHGKAQHASSSPG